MMQRDEAIHVQGGPAPILVQIDKSVGRQFLIIIYVSAVITSLALAGLFLLYDSHRLTRAHVNILEYDLMDLRAKTGHAHENTE